MWYFSAPSTGRQDTLTRSGVAGWVTDTNSDATDSPFGPTAVTAYSYVDPPGKPLPDAAVPVSSALTALGARMAPSGSVVVCKIASSGPGSATRDHPLSNMACFSTGIICPGGTSP